MATLGNTAQKFTPDNVGENLLIVYGPFTASVNGTIDSISMRLDGNRGAGTPQDTNFRYVAYLDSATSPDVRKCVSAAGLVVVSDAEAVVSRSVSGSPVFSSGDKLWIGLHADAPAGGNCCIRNFYDAGADKYTYRTDAPYGSGDPDPFGTPSGGPGGALNYEVYITYTPSGAGGYTWSLGSAPMNLCANPMAWLYVVGSLDPPGLMKVAGGWVAGRDGLRF